MSKVKKSKQNLKGRMLMWKLCFFLSLFVGHAAAQSIIQDVSLKSAEAGAVKVDFVFDGGVVQPEVFETKLPARIALDFANTGNQSGKRNMAIGLGVAKGLRIVSTDSKTRAVVDLMSLAEYEIVTSGNTLSLVLKSKNRAVAKSSGSVVKTRVEMIDFRRGQDGQAVVQVDMNVPGAVINLTKSNQNLIVEISNAFLDEAMDRKLDVVDFATPVDFVDARQAGGAVKIEIEAKGAYEHMAYQTGNRYTLEVTETKKEEIDKSKLLDDEMEYTGHLVSFNFQDVPVRSLLQLVAEASQLNLVVADSVEGNMTLRLNNVPWDQALDIILKAKQLDQRRNGDVIWIAPATEIAEREEAALEALSKKQELEPLENIFIQVNYAKAKDLAVLIDGGEDLGTNSNKAEQSNRMLSDRGSVTFDERTNTLLVTDVPDRLRMIQDMIKNLDRSVRQVQIESRIVIASEKFGDELGVRFGINGSHEDRYGNVISTGGSASAVDRMTNAALTNRYTSRSGSGLPTIHPNYTEISGNVAGAPLGERLNVNLPSAASNASKWAVSILAADYLLDLELSALETEDRGEVISSPRVITANQTEAIIKQGVEIPYEQATSSGATSITFKEATLSLVVTPLITPDDKVDLVLKVNQDAIGQQVTTALGGQVPSIDTRSVETRVLVDNGQTVVLGGIYQQIRNTKKSKVPVLGDLPGLGGLFRNKKLQDDKAELLIFVTPTIIKESL